ncbi:MAG: hypothetical protein AAGA30_10455, partial [Planctomycetota bacterium]
MAANEVVNNQSTLSKRVLFEVLENPYFCCGLTLVDRAIVSGTRLLVSILIARYAGVEDLGLFTLAMSVTIIFGNLENALIS